jgi:hypothetical protein
LGSRRRFARKMRYSSLQTRRKSRARKVTVQRAAFVRGFALIALFLVASLSSSAISAISAETPPESKWRAPTDRFSQNTTNSLESTRYEEEKQDKGRFESDLIGGRSEGDSRDFFVQGSARSVFFGRASLTTPPKVHILNSSIPRFEEDVEEEALSTDDKNQKEEDLSKLPLRERLMKKYGDPEKDVPVLAKDDAPTPMKAMMEAFEANDEELAYKYARQLVRFNRETVDRAVKVVELSQYAKSEQGYIPEIEESGEDDYEGLRYAAQRTSESENKQSASLTVELDPKLQEFIKQAETEESKTPQKSSGKGLFDEAGRRQTVRRDYARNVPVVRGNDKLFVYVFFRPKGTTSNIMLRNADMVYKKFQDNARVEIIALSIDRATEGVLGFVQRSEKLTLPLKSGSGFAAKLGVREAPAVLMVKAGESKGLLETGTREWFELDEMIVMALGG